VSSDGKLIPGRVYSLLEIMRQIGGHHIFLLAQMLGDIGEACSNAKSPDDMVDDTGKRMFETMMSSLRGANLPVSLNVADTYDEMLRDKDSTISYGFLKPQIHALKEAVFAELRTMLFFRMDEEKRTFFEKERLFGDNVGIKFPTASFDIEEGGKCLALGRPTACVFHMMRGMEVGLKALAKDLKIPYAPSWESYIKQIEANITARHKSKSKKWKNILNLSIVRYWEISFPLKSHGEIPPCT
jgi:hypothetical protein